MSDQDIKVQTFNELRLLAEDQLNRIPLRKVSRISLNSLRRQESDIEVYEFVFGKVVHCFDPDEFETEVSVALLPEVLKHLDKIVIELKDNALSCFLLDNLKAFLSFANLLLNFAEYVFQVSETYQLYRTTTIFLEFLVRSYEIVRRSRATANGTEGDEHGVVQQIFVICQKIQLIVIHLLTPSDRASHYFQHVEVEEQFTCLKDVIITFCKIGSLTIGIDNMRCTEAWKAVGKLCSLHEAQIKANETAWMHGLISETNDEIEAAFKLLLGNKEFSRNDMVKLKLINLILRVLIKFLHLIKVDEYGEYPGILRTTVAIEDALLSRNIGKEFTEAIRQHLVVGYMTVIGLSFKTSSFVKALTSVNFQSTEEITAFYNIIILILSKLVSESRDERVVDLYTKNSNLLVTCVEYLSKSHGVFNQHKHLYRQLLVHLSAFVILCSRKSSKKCQKMLEETLVKMILQDDSYWVGMMGLDIWSVYLRYHPVELLWQYFEFWQVVNNRFSVFISQTKAVFVRRLIRNMYTFMPKSMQQEVMTKYSVTDPGNNKLWMAIGLKAADKHITEIIRQSLLRNLKENCSNLLRRVAVEEMYAALHMLHLLCSSEDKNLLQKAEYDVTLFWKALKHDKRWSTKYNTLVYTILNVTIQLAKHGSCSNVLQRAILENFTEVSKLSFQSATSKQKLLELVSLVPENGEHILKILAKDQNMLIRVSTLHAIASIPQSKVRENVCRDVILFAALQRIRKDVSAPSHNMHYGIQTTLKHRCNENDEAAQITQHISDRIDELFPDDDEDFDIPEKILRTESSPAAKRPKLSVYETSPSTDSPERNRGTADGTIAELSRQVKILQQLRSKNLLSADQLAKIRRIHIELSEFVE